MNKELKEIFKLENSEKYNEVYLRYQKLIFKNTSDFECWKYYFFFLWSMIEDVKGILSKEIDLRTELETELKNGMNKYSELADFNFIVGYTISIFPYEFGDYEELDIIGRKMLEKAYEIDQKNPIYKMAYLGSRRLNRKEQKDYEKACSKSQKIIKMDYSGKGLLNEYFNQVFIRDGKEASK